MKSLLFTSILSLRKCSEQILIKFAILLQVRLTHAQTFFRGVALCRVTVEKSFVFLFFDNSRFRKLGEGNGDQVFVLPTRGYILRHILQITKYYHHFSMENVCVTSFGQFSLIKTNMYRVKLTVQPPCLFIA
jgi:hypothetical protein